MIYIKEFIERNSKSCVIMHTLPGSSLYRGNNVGRVDTCTGQRLFRGEGDMMERDEEIERRKTTETSLLLLQHRSRQSYQKAKPFA